MHYLVDTHIFLWWLTDNKKLKESVVKILTDSENQVYVSVTSGWEISIKNKAGKLPLKTTLKRCFELAGFEILNVSLDHVLSLDGLPLYHKDPFDRILIAQAQAENLTLITSDQKIWKYPVKVIKC